MRRVALVTGGARGIGRAVGLHQAANPRDVGLGFPTSATAPADTGRELEALGARALAFRADVSEEARAAELFESVRAELGPPDALVHAAGPYHRAALLDETPAGWRAMMAGNLDSFFYCARLAAPSMIERGFGRIVAFGMANADRAEAFPSVAAHYVAKVGVLALVRTFARALAAHGITVNAVSPGYVDSGSDAPEALEDAVRHIPAGRLGTVEDAAGAVAYFLSDESAYVTGANLIVSGGWGL